MLLSFEDFCIACLQCHVQQSTRFVQPRPWSVHISTSSHLQQLVTSVVYNIQVPTTLAITIDEPYFSLQHLSQNKPFYPSDHFRSAYISFLYQTDPTHLPGECKQIYDIVKQYSQEELQLLLLTQFPSFDYIFPTYCVPYLQSKFSHTIPTITTEYDDLIHNIYTSIYSQQHGLLSSDIGPYKFPVCKLYPWMQYIDQIPSLFDIYKQFKTPCLQLIQCTQCLGFFAFFLQYHEQPMLETHPCQLNQFTTCNPHALSELCHKMLFRRQKSMEFVHQFLFATPYQDDVHFLSYLRSQSDFIQQFQTQSFDKGTQRLKEIERFLQTLKPNGSFQYLDFGGQSGQLASTIQSYFHLQETQVYVADFRSLSHHTFASSTQTTWLYSHKLPFTNNHFHFITCFQVLHHIEKPDITIKELYRILQPGGYLLIREHDIRNMQDSMITDIEHTLFDFVLHTQRPITHVHDHFTSYTSKLALRNDFVSVGFTHCSYFSTQPKGPTRYYYDVFLKPI